MKPRSSLLQISPYPFPIIVLINERHKNHRCCGETISDLEQPLLTALFDRSHLLARRTVWLAAKKVPWQFRQRGVLVLYALNGQPLNRVDAQMTQYRDVQIDFGDVS